MKTVVLAEKPSVGRDIARVLKCTKQGNGFFEGSKYIVTWALGHLVELQDPEYYDSVYKTWQLEDLPMMPDTLKTTVMKKTNRQFQTVKTQLTRKDVTEIVIATDAGREGELVARWILEKAHVNKPVKRLWISSVTDQAIQNGFNHLKPGKDYERLFESAVARSEADWYVGLNATRALTTKFNAQLSSGRVQTPTLQMIAWREQEIQTFQPKNFFGLVVDIPNTEYQLKWTDKQNNTRIYDESKLLNMKKSLKGQPLKIVGIDKKEKKQFAPALYDLTELQRDANRIFGYSGKQTLQLMQRLYERHKLLTYPRTDSRVITTDIVPTLNERIKASSEGAYSAIAKKLIGRKFNLPKSVVNDQAVSDHHAIIPTEQPAFTADLDARELKIYDLVVKRFLAVLSEPYVYEELTITASMNQEQFQTKTIRDVSLGWKEIYQELSKNMSQSNEVNTNLKLDSQFMEVNLGETKGTTEPPARFTEGTLLSAMENPARFMKIEDKQLTKTLANAGGLGTVATRADIIEKLFNTQLMEARGKAIYLTSKGKQLLELVPDDLKSPLLTAEWEGKLEQIAAGKLSKTDFIKEIKQYTKSIVNEIKNKEATFKHDNVTGTKCPECGKLMLEINNKQGKRLVCQDRSCGHKKNIAKNTNARCPKCHKRLQLRGEGEGQTFYCSCGHREKLAAFEKRKKTRQKEKVSKKDMNKYLKKDDGFSNNAFADAFAKLKDK